MDIEYISHAKALRMGIAMSRYHLETTFEEAMNMLNNGSLKGHLIESDLILIRDYLKGM